MMTLESPKTLYDQLIDVSLSRVTCFLDTKTIQSGRDFEEDIVANLRKADWLVCIYTGEQNDYCGYEIGVFKNINNIPSSAKDERLVCLHDVDTLPGVFRNHQNHRITFPDDARSQVDFDDDSFYRSSPITSFFKNFYRYKNLYVTTSDGDGAERQIAKILHQSKRLTEAFKTARRHDVLADTPTQLRLEVSITDNARSNLTSVPDDAEITGTYQSFGLFGLMPHMVNRQLPVASWGQLKRVMTPTGSPTPIWLEDLEQDMVNAANGVALTGREVSFNRDRKIWRPVLYRHLLYEGGGHRFEILFVQTLPRQFLGASRTSALLATIIMASRFRFKYFEESDTTDASFKTELTSKTVEIKCRQLVYDLECLDYEAMEFGLDPQGFVKAFGEEEQSLAESFLETWNEAKKKLVDVVRPVSGPRPD